MSFKMNLQVKQFASQKHIGFCDQLKKNLLVHKKYYVVAKDIKMPHG
jgi:hypothetical protein